MPNYNRVIMMGHLTRDPEMRYSQGGMAICKIGLAVNSGWGDKKKVCFIDCTAFDKRAESLEKHFSKGNPIHIEGRLELDQWEDKESGAKRSKHAILIEQWTFCGGDQGEKKPKPTESEDFDDIPF